MSHLSQFMLKIVFLAVLALYYLARKLQVLSLSIQNMILFFQKTLYADLVLQANRLDKIELHIGSLDKRPQEVYFSVGGCDSMTDPYTRGAAV